MTEVSDILKRCRWRKHDMATPSIFATSPMNNGSHNRDTIEELQEFLTSSCAAYEPPHACVTPAVHLTISPPPLYEEFSHEHALGFLFADEMKVVRQLQQKYVHGRDFFIKLYFARGCASAIPPAPPAATDTTEVARLLRYYGGVYDVLRPQVAKLRMLCDYCTQTVSVLSDTIQRIAAQENTHRVIPDVLLDSILDVMDIVLQMNQLHDTKSSLRNDFSLFKRAFKHVQGDISDPENIAKEIQQLQEFVGSTAQSKNAIWDSLKHNLTSVKRYTHVVFLLVKQCIGHLESKRCLLPDEKFKYIRLLPCLMAILNADPIHGNHNSFHGTERRLIEATGRIVGRYPIVPVFADLCVKPLEPVWEPNLKAKVDHPLSDRNWDPAYELGSVALQARKDAAEFLPKLLFAVNKMSKECGKIKDDALPASIANLTIEGVRLIAEWRMSVNLFLCSKFQQPKSDDQLEHIGVSLETPHIEYQRVFTHNFEPEECSAVADIIHTIKSVAQVFRHHATYITGVLRRYLYAFIQEFIQHTLVAIMHRADKKKHTSLKILQDLRIMCGDWLRDEQPMEDFKKRRRDRLLPDLKHRKVAPSRSHLQMLRTAVNAVYSKRTSGDLDPKTNIFAFHRELKSSDVTKLHEFYMQTADFGILLDLDQVVEELCSFPEMLFRELILEITKSPQLPVDDSFPWLILNRSSQGGQGGLNIVSMLSLLDVYNDAIGFVLLRAEQQIVWHEIFAEATLFFDNVIYMIADTVFTAAKSEVARSFLGSECLSGLDVQNGTVPHGKKASSFIRNVRSISTLQQLEFLGDHHNVMLLVSGHLNSRFMRDLSSSVTRLSRVDATIYVAAADLVEVLERAHSLLIEYFALDSFAELWQEASTRTTGPHPTSLNASTALIDKKRLQRIVSAAVTHDLVTRFGFNERTRRFYRTPLALELRTYVVKARTSDTVYVTSTKEMATSSSKKLLDGVGFDRDCRVGFELVHQPYRSFVGVQHFKAMLSFLSDADVVQVVEDWVEHVLSQIEEVAHLFIPVLGSAIPPYRFPRLLYRTEGCYGYFESKFRHMMESKELEAHVFHCLRIIGNSLLSIYYVDQVTKAEGQSFKPDAASGGFFARALQRLHAFLLTTNLVSLWGADAQSSPEQVEKNSSTFYLVWNGLEYLACCPPRHGGLNCYREAYGEGVSFAGCTLIHLLGQRRLYDMWNPSQYVIDARKYDSIKNMTTATFQQAAKGRKSTSVSVPTSPTSPQAVGTVDAEMLAHTTYFVTQATQLRQTTEHFFFLLESAWSASTSTDIPHRSDFAAPT